MIEIAPLMMSSPVMSYHANLQQSEQHRTVCEEILVVYGGVTNLVTPDDNVSRNTIRLWICLQQTFDTSWRLSRATNHETQIDKRACASAFVIAPTSPLDTSYDTQIDLVKLFGITDLAGGDRYRDEVKNNTLGNQH